MGIVIVALEPILNPIWVALVTGVVPSRLSLIGGAIIVTSVVGYALHQALQGQRARNRIRNAVAAAVMIGGCAFFGPAETSEPGETVEASGPDCLGVRAEASLRDLRALQASQGHAEAERTQWMPAVLAPGASPRGVAVVVHGLNLRPSRMDELAAILAQAGYNVVRAALSGHGGNVETYRTVTRARYLADMESAVCSAVAHAREKSPDAARPLPVVLVGFSLGALVAQDLINTEAFTKSPFAAQVLFAPAIAVRPFTHAVRALWFWPSLSLPSLSLEEYRASPGTPIAAYSALFASRAALLDGTMERSRVPTLVFTHPDDELVSLSGTRSLMETKGLASWQIDVVNKAGHGQSQTVNHLIVDARSFGVAEWQRVTSRLLGFLP